MARKSSMLDILLIKERKSLVDVHINEQSPYYKNA